jgi:plasmid stabilization system protein ParE
MNLDAFFNAEAKAEFFEAIVWYEEHAPGLGREFAQEVFQTIRRAQTQPHLFRKLQGGARKIRLSRFKHYSIYFAVKDDVFGVIAIFHGARNPADLESRLG